MPLEMVLSWWRRRTLWEQAALAVWAGALVALCLPSLADPHNHSVYPVYESAGKNWLTGNDLYPTEHKGPEFLFRYSPLVAAWFAPWSLLPDRLANVAWRLLNAGFFLVALWWYCRRVLPAWLSKDQCAQLFLLCIPLVGANIFNGQSNPLVLGLILLCTAGVAASRWNLAALALALACTLKVYPVALGLLLMIRYPRSFAPRFLLAMAIGAALPFILQDRQYVLAQYGYWLQHMRNNDRHGNEIWNWPHDPRLLLHCLGFELSYTGYLLMEAAVGCFIAFLCGAAWLSSVSARTLLNLSTCLTCCWMTAFGPSTESCTYCLVAPVLGWLLVDRDRHGTWLRAATWCAYATLCVPIAAGWVGLHHETYMLPWQPLGGIVLFLCVVVVAFHAMRTDRQLVLHPSQPLAPAA
jgi:hypothetical protein